MKNIIVNVDALLVTLLVSLLWVLLQWLLTVNEQLLFFFGTQACWSKRTNEPGRAETEKESSKSSFWVKGVGDGFFDGWLATYHQSHTG